VKLLQVFKENDAVAAVSNFSIVVDTISFMYKNFKSQKAQYARLKPRLTLWELRVMSTMERQHRKRTAAAALKAGY
jgi:hypothetical protein